MSANATSRILEVSEEGQRKSIIIMSESKRRNPFEEHINTNLDVSHLGAGVAQKSPLQQEVDNLLLSVMDEQRIICEHYLSEEQRDMSYCLSQAITQDVLRKFYADDVQDLEDNELEAIVHKTITLAMFADDQLVKAKQPKPEPVPIEPYGYPENPTWNDMRQFVNGVYIGLKNLLQRLFKRY